MTISKITILCLNNGIKRDYPAGVDLFTILQDQQIDNKTPFLGALVNNKPKEMGFQLFRSKTIRFIDFTDVSGHRAYIHSLCFVMYKAVEEVVPGAKLKVEHGISNGYFVKIRQNGVLVDADCVAKIKEKMAELIEANIPFERKEEETEKVIALLEKQNMDEKAKLHRSLGKMYTVYHTLDGLIDIYYNPLVPSTGYLPRFDLVPYYNGYLLSAPLRNNPEAMNEVVKQDKLIEIFSEFSQWNRVMGASNISDLNSATDNGDVANLIKVAEAFHEKKVVKIIDQIMAREGKVKFVLVSGPSSSGKTTFSKRLALQLLVSGLHPVNLSLDDYFVSREDTPKDEHGEYDYESLYALDIPLFNSDMSKLLSGEVVEIPTFSFAEGRRVYKGSKLNLRDNSVLIIEGIHALNPELTSGFSDEFKFKIYVSALTTVSIDDHNWIPTSDNRLIRRIVRDFRYRGYSAADTINRWASVRKGEDKWIYPYQECADAMFNSALIFELPIFKPYAEPILHQVRQDSPAHAEAHRLLQFFGYFKPIRDREIPPTSLLREFLGGSSFKY